MPDWYAHLTWTSAATVDRDALTRLTDTIRALDHGPDVVGYVLHLGGLWRAGFVVGAESIGDAAAGAASTLRTAALHAGQDDAELESVEILSSHHQDRWRPVLPGVH